MTAIWTVLAIAAYFIPTLVALLRRATNRGSVFVIDLFLGWTVIGWIVALAMAVRTSTIPRAGEGTGVGRWAADITDGIKGPRG